MASQPSHPTVKGMRSLGISSKRCTFQVYIYVPIDANRIAISSSHVYIAQAALGYVSGHAFLRAKKLYGKSTSIGNLARSLVR